MEASKTVSLSVEHFDPADGLKDKKNPIIFLHALLCSKEIWADIPQTVANSTGRRVYTYDARNHGKTTHANESDFSFSFNVKDLFLLMDEIKANMPKDHPEKFEPTQFVLVGHDMGGMTAIRAALEKPSQFEMVFVVEMYAEPVPSQLIERTKKFMNTWRGCVQDLPEGTSKKEATRISVESLYEKLDDEMKQLQEKASYLKGEFDYKETEKGLDAYYNADALDKALKELLEKQDDYKGDYNGPTYFFYGTESFYKVNERKDSMEKHFPKAELVKFDNGSHMFVIDMPAELAKKIVEKINADKNV